MESLTNFLKGLGLLSLLNILVTVMLIIAWIGAAGTMVLVLVGLFGLNRTRGV